MSVTLRDVARQCGLSPSTVSGVLNNRANTWASLETRQRILDAAESLGYRPNQAARSLRTGKTFVVSLIYHVESPLQHLTFDGAAEIMAAHLGKQGYELKLHVYPSQVDLMVGLEDLVRRQSCDAVVLIGRESDVIHQGRFLEENEIPFVVKGRHEQLHPHWYQVDYDHEGMMRSVVEHFHSQGHQRIAYLGHNHTEVYQTCLFSGFHDAIRGIYGSEPRADMVLRSNTSPHLSGPQQFVEMLTRPEADRPTALTIGTGSGDWREIERLLALKGCFIGDNPEEFAIAGQAESDLYLVYGNGWRFTDVSYASIAEIAVNDLLLPLLRGEQPPSPIRRILPKLIPTASLKLPRP